MWPLSLRAWRGAPGTPSPSTQQGQERGNLPVWTEGHPSGASRSGGRVRDLPVMRELLSTGGEGVTCLIVSLLVFGLIIAPAWYGATHDRRAE
jgi:hypothetical protein